MAPKRKPIPKNAPKADPITKLLEERELEYQGAMGIAVNDLRAKEAELLQIKEAYEKSGMTVEGFDEFLASKYAEIRRAYRDIVSEPSYLFENDVRNYAIGSGNPLDVTKTEAGQRKISQPIPGTQAHHPASVSSVESYLRNMPMAEQRRTLELLTEQGYTIGSQAKGFIPLSGPAHLGGGERWGRDFAHVGKEGVESDPGRFKGTALPKNTTAEQAVAVMKPMLDEQIALNTAAYSHPVEQKMRGVAERLLGKPITWMGGEATDVQAQNKAAKAMGINATTISKAYSKYPELMESGKVPNVDVMTDVGTRIPLGMKPSEEVRKQATAVVRNPMMPDRKTLRAMAAAGLVAPSVLGTAASAAETAGRVQLARQTGNPVDWLQAGLAGASSAGDVAGYTGALALPGEIVSTAADLANVAIDTARMPPPRPASIPKAQTRPRTTTAARTQGQTMPKAKPIDIENELRWLGKAGQRAFQSVFGGREI